MALAEGTYPYTITATRADGVTNTASGTVVVGSGVESPGVVAQLGTITGSQTLHSLSVDIEPLPVTTQLGTITNNQTLHRLSTDVVEVPMVTVNGATYLPSADGKIYGQYPLGDAPVGATLPTYADRTKLVTASASGGGDGSEGSPWTLTEAMASAVAGDIVGIDEGIYTGTSGSYFDPAFEPTNSGTAGSPIVFVAKNPAATNTTNLTEIRSGATTQGAGRAAFGAVGQDYIYFIGFKSDNTVANNKTAVDLGACMLWNTTGSKVMQCEFIGESSISNNYSGIRLEITDGAECADNVISGYSNDTNSAGILIYKSNSFSLHHNTISNCNNGVQLKGADGADTINNIEVYLNLIHDCSNAFRLHGPVKGPSSELNLIYQNICYNNTNSFEFTSSSTHTGEQDGLRVFNNVFYNTSDGDIWVNHNYDAGRDNAFFNNIFRTTAAYLRGTYTGASDVTHHQNFADYERNCISGATAFGNGTSASALDSLTFNDWQTTYSEDANSTTSDPLFTNEVAQDFTLQGGSPCVGLGRDRLGKFGAVDATIDAGVYVIGDEVVGIRGAATTITPLGGVSFDGLASGQSITPLVTAYGTLGNGYGCQGDTAIKRSGKTSSCNVSIQSGTTGRPGDGAPVGNGDFGFIYSLADQGHQVLNGEELWVYGWIYIPSGFNFNTAANGLKFLRFSYLGLGPELDTYISDGQEFSTGDNTENAGWQLVNESYPQLGANMRKETQSVFAKGQWNFFCKYTKASTSQADSVERLWINDQFVMEHVGGASDVTTKWIDETGTTQTATWTPSAGSGNKWATLSDQGTVPYQISSMYLFTYWNNNAPQDQSINIQQMQYVKSNIGLATDSFGNRHVQSTQVV